MQPLQSGTTRDEKADSQSRGPRRSRRGGQFSSSLILLAQKSAFSKDPGTPARRRDGPPMAPLTTSKPAGTGGGKASRCGDRYIVVVRDCLLHPDWRSNRRDEPANTNQKRAT